MSSDTSPRESATPGEDLWRLPDVVDVQIRLVHYTPPRQHVVPGPKVIEATEAVEFLVRTNEEVPVRTLGPALFVGTIEVNESEHVGPNLYRFVAYEPARLRRGATISVGWSGAGRTHRKRTHFRYEVSGEETR
jgi:hypothetical protein